MTRGAYNFLQRLGAVVMAATMMLWSFGASAANLEINLKLIWGTNDAKSPNPKHKPVSPELTNKLRKIFQWKNYFEVNDVTGRVPSRQSKKFRLSDKCEIEITEMEGPKVEIKLYGEGKVVNKITKPLVKGESVFIGAEDKGENSWFIMISLLNEN